jgi:photosystem II stability/assembly factor-like uncharacterized protein
MKYILFSFLFLLSFGRLSAQSGWFALPVPENSSGYSIPYFSNDTGYITATIPSQNDKFTLYRTVDGGHNWEQITVPFSNYIQVRFFNAYSFYFTVAINDSLILYTTTDGGQSWSLSALHHTKWWDVSFLSSSVGFISGSETTKKDYYAGIIKKTEDAGKTWTTIYVDSSYTSVDFTKVSFSDPDHGYAFLEYTAGCMFYSELWCTTNGGMQWHNTYRENIPVERDLCYHFPATNYWIKSDNGKNISRSTDNGITWTKTFLIQYSSDEHTEINFLAVTSTSLIYAATREGKVIKSTDQGMTWNELSVPIQYMTKYSYPGIYRSLVTTSESVAYIAGKNYILKTIDGGGQPMSVASQMYRSQTSELVQDKFEIILSEKIKQISVYNILGQEVESLNMPSGQPVYSLDVKTYSPGMYFVKVGNTITRFIRQ